MKRIIPTASQIAQAIKAGRDPIEIARAVAQMARWRREHVEELKQYEADAIAEIRALKPLAEMSEREIAEKGVEIIRRLGSERAVAVWGHYSNGLTQRAIAEAMEISVGTVNSTLHELARLGFVTIRKRGGVNPATLKPDTYDPYSTDAD